MSSAKCRSFCFGLNALTAGVASLSCFQAVSREDVAEFQGGAQAQPQILPEAPVSAVLNGGLQQDKRTYHYAMTCKFFQYCCLFVSGIIRSSVVFPDKGAVMRTFHVFASLYTLLNTMMLERLQCNVLESSLLCQAICRAICGMSFRLTMKTSSYGNLFRFIGLSCGKFTSHQSQRPETRSFDIFFDLRLNKQLRKQWRRWLFETPSRSLWHPFDADKRFAFFADVLYMLYCCDALRYMNST